MSKHWTERSVKDFLHRIASDFVTQLEKRMEALPLTQAELAKKLNISEGRVSQILNNPGNISLLKIIEYSRALDLKVAIVAYENNNGGNGGAPINSEIFSICWEKYGKPVDFFSLEKPLIEFNEELYLLEDKQSATQVDISFLPSNEVVKDFVAYKQTKAIQANNLNLANAHAA